MAQKYLSLSPKSVAAMVEHTLGCRWMIPLLEALCAGENRPNRLQRTLQSGETCITAKVLNERLNELLYFGIIDRRVIATTPNETPSHVEYHFTPFGKQFLTILETVKEVQVWLNENDQ